MIYHQFDEYGVVFATVTSTKPVESPRQFQTKELVDPPILGRKYNAQSKQLEHIPEQGKAKLPDIDISSKLVRGD